MSYWCTCTIRRCKSSINFATVSISASKKNLLHWSFHFQPVFAIVPICWMCWCCCWEIWYSLGYFSLSETPSSIHPSSQNKTFDPHPTFHFVPFLSQLPSSNRLQTKQRSRHRRDSLMDLLVASKFLQPPYFYSRTCAHSSPWWLNKFQHHFSSKAKLNFPKSLIPKPPFSFGRQIVP